jgi:hypothetical protein
MEKVMPYDPKGDETNVGALADGFANSAINDTEISDDSTGYVGGLANGDNRNNTDVDVDTKLDVDANNGNNRDNSYDWDYDSKTTTLNDNDTKTVTDVDTDIDTDMKSVTGSYNSSDYDWSYDSKTTTLNDNDTKTVTDVDTDIKTVSDNDSMSVSDNDTTTVTTSTANSFNHTDTDFAVLDDVKDFDNLGIAGRDLTFDIGDDFSFTLDVDRILNDSLTGAGNDSGFSAIQANHLADQDVAYDLRMNNEDADNHLKADGGTAFGDEGMNMDGKGWDLGAGDDVSGASTADASAILANSGFHFELVQGTNLLTNSIDSSVVGGDHYVTNVGEDTSGS